MHSVESTRSRQLRESWVTGLGDDKISDALHALQAFKDASQQQMLSEKLEFGAHSTDLALFFACLRFSRASLAVPTINNAPFRSSSARGKRKSAGRGLQCADMCLGRKLQPASLPALPISEETTLTIHRADEVS